MEQVKSYLERVKEIIKTLLIKLIPCVVKCRIGDEINVVADVTNCSTLSLVVLTEIVNLHVK